MAQAVLQDRETASALLAVHVPDDWPSSDLRDYLPRYAEQLASDPALLGWGIWLMVQQTDQTVIGDVGFKGKPDSDGTVEMGYSALPAYRRKGYAWEAARALVDWAFAQRGVMRISAECEAGNAASIRILEKLGMCRQRQDGSLLRWSMGRPGT